MLYLFGNCQMEFLGNALRGHGLAVDYRPLSSPLTLGRDNGRIPPSLEILQRRFDIERFMHGRSLRNQFQLLTREDQPATALLLNLFHENEPLFAHETEESIFFLNPVAWEELPHLESWMKTACRHVRPHPSRYLQRFTRVLEALVKRRPSTPILLLTRLFHFPAFGPSPYSYLKNWDELQYGLSEALAHWSGRFANLHVLDVNRVFAGIWSRSEGTARHIEAHCPFLRATPQEGAESRNGMPRMKLERDIEHVGSLWPVLADKVVDFLEQGEVRYADEEKAPQEWGLPNPELEDPDDATLLAWLRSGSNYTAGRAVAAMLAHPGRDRTELLLQAAGEMPVCHNILHMVDNYGLLRNNPALETWCEVHADTARGFDANGELYTRQYLERLEEIAARTRQAAAA